jgi:TPR repeat protein
MKKRLIYAAAMAFILFAATGLFAQDPNITASTTTKSSEYFKQTLKKAETGDAKAQYYIGLMYSVGEDVPQDYKEAARWLCRSAEKGNVDAQFNIGFMYYNGEGVPKDYKEAFKWYIKAAEQESAKAQFFLGLMYEDGLAVTQDYKEAAKWYTKAALQGHAGAQTNLGVMYYRGEGVLQDYKETVKWWNKAAEQGQALAQSKLGTMYELGQGVLQNYTEAVKWYAKATEQGDAGAQFGLGMMYWYGQGVTEDYIEAYKWINLAAAQGYKPAVKSRDLMRAEMSAAQIAEAQRLSKEFKPKTHEQATLDAQNPEKVKIKSSGTGFFITTDGYLLTAYHVVSDIEAIQVKMGKELNPAKVVRVDVANDIALLKVDGVQVDALALQSSRDVKVGQEIFTLGFPNIQIQGTEAKYTQGSINSLSGIGDDPRLFQISTAVQPGNSGGPLLDSDGQVVGLVVAKLDEIATAKETGSLPQNVNYALKSSFVLSFLESLPELNGKLLEPKKAGLPRTQIVEKTSKAVVMVLCY